MKKLLLMTLTILLCAFEIAFATCTVELTWDASPESDIAGYRIFVHLEEGLYNYYDPVWEGTETITKISDLPLEQTYYFVVRAFDTEQLESRDSNEVSFYASSPPCGGEDPVGLTITGLGFDIIVDGQALISNRLLTKRPDTIERSMGEVSEGIGKTGDHFFQLFDEGTEVFNAHYALPEDTSYLRVSAYPVVREYVRDSFAIGVFASDYYFDENNNPIIKPGNVSFWNVEISTDGNNWTEILQGNEGHVSRVYYPLNGLLYPPGIYYLKYYGMDGSGNKAVTFLKIDLKQPAFPIIENIRIIESLN